MHGAGHESGRRAGTENTMHMVALGTACRLCKENMVTNVVHMRSVRDLLHQELLKAFPDLTLNGWVSAYVLRWVLPVYVVWSRRSLDICGL